MSEVLRGLTVSFQYKDKFSFNALVLMKTRGNVLSFGEERVSLKNLGRRLKVIHVNDGEKRHDRTGGMSAERLQKKRKNDLVGNMNDDRKRKRVAAVNTWNSRRSVGRESSGVKDGDVNRDAEKYLQHFNGKTHMWLCAVCGSEEGECDMKRLEDVPTTVFEESDMATLFARAVQSSDKDGSGNAKYAESIRSEFHSTGLLKEARHVCKLCIKELRSHKSVGVESMGMDECAEEEDEGGAEDNEGSCDGEAEDEGNVNMFSEPSLRVPRKAYLRGLYPGVIPLELRDLRTVELSMVSIYNPVTRLKLNCKGMAYKYYHGRANTYTIVNDVTTVASVLPQLPSIQTFAILRYTNEVCTKELKYRPGIVRRALEWLKRHNHLYKDITVKYPEDWVNYDLDCEIEPETLVIDEGEREVLESGKADEIGGDALQENEEVHDDTDGKLIYVHVH